MTWPYAIKIWINIINCYIYVVFKFCEGKFEGFFDYSALSLVWKVTISTGKIGKNMLISFSLLIIERELHYTIMILHHDWVNVWKQMVNFFLLNLDYLISSWSEGCKWLHLACPTASCFKYFKQIFIFEYPLIWNSNFLMSRFVCFIK